MEIERKWMTQGWPQWVQPQRILSMDQGYIALRPTVRIRREAEGDQIHHILCFKGRADAQGLAREEIETEIAPDLFARLEELIGQPLIRKEQRRYSLEDGWCWRSTRWTRAVRRRFSTPRWSSPPGRRP